MSRWSFVLQVRFVWYELKGEEAAAFGFIKRTRNVHDATFMVMKKYERPSVERFDARWDAAKYVHRNYGLQYTPRP